MIANSTPALATGFLLNWRLVLGTSRVYVLKHASNTIQLIRSPIYPILALIGFKIAYDISGQTTVPQSEVLGLESWRSAHGRRLFGAPATRCSQKCGRGRSGRS